MLDDLYRTGIRRETDRPRTERCHRAIAKLLAMTPKNPPRIYESTSHPDITFAGLAQRGGEVLRRMEQCSPLQSSKGSSSKSTKKNGEETSKEEPAHDDGDDDVTTLFGNNVSSFSSYQNVYSNNKPPPHLSFTKFELPTPSREIYNMVLISYAKESGGLHVAQQAEDVVWSMISRVVHQMRQQQRSKIEQTITNECNDDEVVDDGNEEEPLSNSPHVVLPTIENWNCVLNCWSRSTDPDRAYRAYSFLLEWTEWNEACRNNEELREGVNLMDVHYPDLDSFRRILQCCLATAADEFEDEAEFNRAREMGAGVATRLWKERQTWYLALNSAVYRDVLRAICQSSELPCKSAKGSKALNDMARVFTQCREDDMVTPEILDVVRDVTTEKQFAQLTFQKM